MYLHYYRYLNAGFRLPIAGGTDKMSNGVPIGLSRTYARLGPDDDFGYDAWCAALRAGRSYMTSGPLLGLSVNGANIGDTVRLPDSGGTVAVEATAVSIFPMFRGSPGRPRGARTHQGTHRPRPHLRGESRSHLRRHRCPA
jgi:hypothetical protein